MYSNTAVKCRKNLCRMNRWCFLVVAKASKRFKVKYTYIYAGGQYMTIDNTEFAFFTFSPNFVKSKFA